MVKFSNQMPTVIIACILCVFTPAQCVGKTITIGNGSGELNYPAAQTSLGLNPRDTVLINSGTYSGLTMSMLSGAPGAPITIRAGSKVVFTTSHSHSNEVRDLAFVTFDGLRYLDYNGNSMKIGGASHDLIFKNMSMLRGGTFWIYDRARLFDGSKASSFYNFKWENCTFDAAGIISEDWSPISNLVSVDLDFEVSHCSFRNYDCSKGPQTIIDIGKAFNLRVHDCSFSDLGMSVSPVGHDVCIIYRGYAKVYNNQFTREWGDDVRCFPLKLNMRGYNGSDAINQFYNNIAYEKRKYAMFEQNMSITQAELDQSKGYFSRTTSEVYFNTMYRSRKVDYCAPLVDIYAPGITVRYNLIIAPECDAPWNPGYLLLPDSPVDLRSNYVYHVGTDLGSHPSVLVNNNQIFQNINDAALSDDSKFIPSKSSPVIGMAGIVDYIRDDYYHRPRYRGLAADSGAVQHQ